MINLELQKPFLVLRQYVTYTRIIIDFLQEATPQLQQAKQGPSSGGQMFMSSDFFSNLTIGEDETDMDPLANFNPEMMRGRKASSLLFGEDAGNNVDALERDLLRDLRLDDKVIFSIIKIIIITRVAWKRYRRTIQSRANVCRYFGCGSIQFNASYTNTHL